MNNYSATQMMVYQGPTIRKKKKVTKKKETKDDKEYRQFVEDQERFLARFEETRPRQVRISKRHRLCKVCQLWVHPDMLTCQPCGAAVPIYSMSHKFK